MRPAALWCCALVLVASVAGGRALAADPVISFLAANTKQFGWMTEALERVGGLVGGATLFLPVPSNASASLTEGILGAVTGLDPADLAPLVYSFVLPEVLATTDALLEAREVVNPFFNSTVVFTVTEAGQVLAEMLVLGSIPRIYEITPVAIPAGESVIYLMKRLASEGEGALDGLNSSSLGDIVAGIGEIAGAQIGGVSGTVDKVVSGVTDGAAKILPSLRDAALQLLG